MRRLTAPPRCACPRCTLDLRGLPLLDNSFTCPQCRWHGPFWELEHFGGRPKWATQIICIQFAAIALFLSLAIFFVVGRWTITLTLLGALSDAPNTSLPPLHLYLLGLVALPAVLSWVPIYSFLRLSYKKYGWPAGARRARWRAFQTVGVEIAVITLVIAGTLAYLLR